MIVGEDPSCDQDPENCVVAVEEEGDYEDVEPLPGFPGGIPLVIPGAGGGISLVWLIINLSSSSQPISEKLSFN